MPQQLPPLKLAETARCRNLAQVRIDEPVPRRAVQGAVMSMAAEPVDKLTNRVASYSPM
jgi:hypothetical protein